MKRRFLNLFVSLSLVLCMILGLNVPVFAAKPAIKVPAKLYPISTSNNTPAYANIGGAQAGTIYAGDLCTLESIYDDVYGIFTYPISGGKTRTLYAKLSSFFSTTSFTTSSITKSATVFRRSSGSDSLGSVDTRDTSISVFGSQNGRTQILYSVTGTNYYKVGWVDSSAVRTSSPTQSLTLSVITNRYSGTTSDKFDFFATTNIAAAKVTLTLNGNSTVYQMTSSDKKNWSLKGNSLSAGNRTVTITAYPSSGAAVTKTLAVSVVAPATTPSLTLSVSANKYSGTTSDKFDFFATTNIAATKVTLTFNGNSTVYQMTSSDKKNWNLKGNSLSAGNRTVTITAYPSSGTAVTKTLSVSVGTSAPTTATTLTNALYKINITGSKITCGFDGYTSSPKVGNSNPNIADRHEGIDFAYYHGAPIYALVGGIVVANPYDSINTLAIYDETSNKTVIYLHSQPLSSLTYGKIVSKGQQIGTESNKGAGSQTHTHVEVRDGRHTSASKSLDDPKLDNSNPAPFWQSKGYVVK